MRTGRPAGRTRHVDTRRIPAFNLVCAGGGDAAHLPDPSGRSSFELLHCIGKIERINEAGRFILLLSGGKIERINEAGRFILLLLGAKDSEPVPGRLHLQKEMYMLRNLFQDMASETGYGPCFVRQYGEVVANELEELKMSGLVGSASDSLALTEDGSAVLEELKPASSEWEIRKVEEFKHLLNDMTRDELLAFVRFSDLPPDVLEEESAEYRDLMKKRKRLAISMYKKDKISAQKAAEISGESFEDFFDELKSVP